jgi:hypothetical protein
VKLDPGQFFCLAFDFPSVITNVFMPDNTVIHLDVQWSGAIYASTNCDDDLMCQTGICKECTETECHECPSFRGPVGPVAQAARTFTSGWSSILHALRIGRPSKATCGASSKGSRRCIRLASRTAT